MAWKQRLADLLIESALVVESKTSTDSAVSLRKQRTALVSLACLIIKRHSDS